MLNKKLKKAFTLIEVLIATIFVGFVYTIIFASYKIQQKELNNWTSKVQSLSLGEAWWNFLDYLLLSRKVKFEKKYKEQIVQSLLNNDENTNFYLSFWFDNKFPMFIKQNGQIIRLNDVPDNSYWTLWKEMIEWTKMWVLKQINWPDDTDHMILISNFDPKTIGEDRNNNLPYFYIKVNKEPTWKKFNWQDIYKLKITENFYYEKTNKLRTFQWYFNPFNL